MLKERFKNVLHYPINGRQIYFLAFVIYFLPAFLNDTTFAETFGDHWLRILSYLSIPLLLFKVYVLDNWNIRQQSLITLMFLLGLLTWRVTHEVHLLIIFPFVIAAKNVSFKDIMSWYLYIGASLMLSVAVIALLGIIPNLIYYDPQRPTRYSLGMDYPSTIATHYLYFCLAYCYLKFGKLKWFDYGLVIIGDIICMLLTNTRLDFIATLLLVPVVIIAQRAFKGYQLSRIFASFWWMAVPVTAWVTIISSYFFNPSNHVMRTFNSLFSGRLFLGHEAFGKYKINLFGRTIKEHTYVGSKGLKLSRNIGPSNIHYFYIDSGYMRMILLWGLIVSILLITVMTYLAIRSTIHKTFILSALILIASLNFMFEPYLINIVYNPLLLALLAKPDLPKFLEGKNE